MTDTTKKHPDTDATIASDDTVADKATPVPSGNPDTQKEVGGRKGPEPTRFGDWEKNGIISDF